MIVVLKVYDETYHPHFLDENLNAAEGINMGDVLL